MFYRWAKGYSGGGGGGSDWLADVKKVRESGTREVGLTNTGNVSLKVCCCILRKNPPRNTYTL